MNINLAPDNPYLAHHVPQGVNPQLVAPVPAPASNPPAEGTFTANLKPFNLLDNGINLEGGVIAAHYEFYTTITFTAIHGNQQVIRKSDAWGTVKLILICTDINVPLVDYQKTFDPTARIGVQNIAKGITKEHHTDFVAWVFDNTVPNGMGAFLINHDPPFDAKKNRTNITSFTLGLDFTTDDAKRASAVTPPGGWDTTPAERTMSDKRWRIYAACQSQRDGILQVKRCTMCQKRASRECRKMEGKMHCTWCIQLGKPCEVEKAGTGSGSGKTDDDNHDDDQDKNDDDAKKPKRTSGRRKSTKHLPDDSIYFQDNDGDDNDEPKQKTSSRRSSKHKLDDDDFDEAAIPDTKHQPKRSRSDRRKSHRPQIEDNSGDETRQKPQKIPARKTSRPSLGGSRENKTPGRVDNRPSVGSLRRPSTPATAPHQPDSLNDNNMPPLYTSALDPSGRYATTVPTPTLAQRLAARRPQSSENKKPTKWTAPTNVPARDQTRSMMKVWGGGMAYPEYQARVPTSGFVSRRVAMSLQGVKGGSAGKRGEGGEKEDDGESEQGGKGDEADERPRGGGAEDDEDELDKSIEEMDLGDECG